VTTNSKALPVLAVLITACFLSTEAHAPTTANGAAVDAEVKKLMAHTNARGMAVAVSIKVSRLCPCVRYPERQGRSANGRRRNVWCIAYQDGLCNTVMQLVDQGKLSFDAPIRDDLDKPLPSYGPIRSSRTSTGQTIAAQELQIVILLMHACAASPAPCRGRRSRRTCRLPERGCGVPRTDILCCASC